MLLRTQLLYNRLKDYYSTDAVPDVKVNTDQDNCQKHLGGAVKSEISVSVEVEERLEDVEHLGHLSEDERTMRLGFHTPQQDVHRLQLTYTHTHTHRLTRDRCFTPVIPKLWPAGHFWPAASYKMARQDLWLRIFYLHHFSV